MNPIFDVIHSHRSIRKFENKPVSDDMLSKIVAAGQCAASSSNVQAVSVIHVTRADVREKIAELAGGQTYVASAGAFLVYCADLQRPAGACERQGGQFSPGMTEHFMIATIDVALAAQTSVLAAESLGLGICYIGGIRNNPTEVSALLNLPGQVYPVFGLCLGYPAQDPQIKPRLPISAVLKKDTYDQSEDEQWIAEYDALLREYYRTRTGGNKISSWSEEMRALVGKESRPHMRKFLKSQGFEMR